MFEHVVTSDEVIEQRSLLLHCMSPLLAQSGHHDTLNQCPLLGVKRTLLTRDKGRRIAANIAKLTDFRCPGRFCFFTRARLAMWKLK